MMETAQRLYEQYTQSGAPSLTLMDRIRERMMPMNFKVTKEAAGFATEARIHHMCTVANLIRACCFEGLANDLVTNKPGPQKVHRLEGSADQRGRREVTAPVRHAGKRRARWQVRTTRRSTAVWPCHPRI